MEIIKRAVALLVVIAVVLTLSIGVTSVFAVDSGIDGSFAFDEQDVNHSRLRLRNETSHNSELLCVKITNEDLSSVRLVSVAMSWILKSAEDYGYMLYTFDKSEINNFELVSSLEEHLTNVKPNAKLSCKGTANSCTEENYGNNVFDFRSEGYTKYKYITMSVNNIPGDKFLVARFYIKKDGEVHYATYNSTEKACVYSTTDILDVIKPHMEIIGHRGAMDIAPQNTFVSFEKAAEYGYQSVEADFWITKSGDLLVMHDNVLNLCGRPDINIKDLDSTSRFMYPIKGGSNYRNYRTQYIPTVEEVIKKVSTLNMKLYLHVKDSSTSDDVIENIISMMRKYDMKDKTMFVTSSQKCCKRIAGHDCNLCFLVNDPTKELVNNGLNLCEEYGVKNIMIEYQDSFPTAANFNRAHELGLKIGVYNASNISNTLWLNDHYCDFSMINYWM